MEEDYIVMKENGIVVKYYEKPGVEDFADEVAKSLPQWAYDLVMLLVISYYFPEYPDVIRGVAKLAKNDTWNEDIGRKVADAKVNLKRHERIAKQAAIVKKALLRVVDEMDKIIEKHSRKAAAIRNDYNSYYLKRGE